MAEALMTCSDDVPYEVRYNPELPWGYWFRDTGHHNGMLVDEAGRFWRSVREGLWHGRLGMVASVIDDHEEDCERLLGVLAALGRPVVPVSEMAFDMFNGETAFARHYNRWLSGAKLIGEGSQWSQQPTPEGHAILLMLAATRPPELRFEPAGRAAILSRAPHDASPPETAAWLEEVERHAARMSARMERRDIGDRPALALTGDHLGTTVPITRTTWLQTFADVPSRDRFFAWAALRMDRWEAWLARAYRHGGQSLTEHFLAMLAGSMVVRPAKPEGGAKARGGTTVIKLPKLT